MRNSQPALLSSTIGDDDADNIHPPIASMKASNDDRIISSKSMHKKLKSVKQKQSTQALLLELDPPAHGAQTTLELNEPFAQEQEQPETPLMGSYAQAMADLSAGNISMQDSNPSLEEFLSVWDDSWSDEQIYNFFSHCIPDSRVITLSDCYQSVHGDDIPWEIWHLIVSFELDHGPKQIRRRYYDWIAMKRREMHWVPYALGILQFFGAFFVLFYSLQFDNIGASNIINGDDINTGLQLDAQFYVAVVTVAAAVLQIVGASVTYYLARFRYVDKLKRFKQIIHLFQKHVASPQPLIDGDDDDEDGGGDDADDGDEKGDCDDEDVKEQEREQKEELAKIKDCPNVEINFDLNQIPQEYRHIFSARKTSTRNSTIARGEDADAADADSDDEKKNDGTNAAPGPVPGPVSLPSNASSTILQLVESPIDVDELLMQQKRLDYMMGMPPSNQDEDVLLDDNGVASLEEMRLVVCAWEAFIAFQRWINISSLVVTDNLSDPYLIMFLLHKYLFVICLSVYVFGLSAIQSLIPFIALFVTFAYLELIVLDRVAPKRAIYLIVSMVSCCGIMIGMVIAILLLLSVVFPDTDSVDYDTGTDTDSDAASNNTSPGFSTTAVDNDVYATSDSGVWVTDIFYPVLGFALCYSTLRRLRRGFVANIPGVKCKLWGQLTFVMAIMAFATNSARWSNVVVKAICLLLFVYFAYLMGQQKLHQAVTRLKKIQYANKYLRGSSWVKRQLFFSWIGQLSKRFG